MSSRWYRPAGLILALAVAVGLWLSIQPKLDLNRVYRIGTDGVFPYHDLTAAGKGRGFVVEVLNEAARRKGVKLEWVRVNQKLDVALKTGEVDLWPLAGRDFLKTLPGVYATAPWMNNDFAFVALEPRFRNPANAGEVRTVAGRGSIGVRGMAASRFRNAKFVDYRDRQASIEAVWNGEADGAIVELRVAHYFLAAPPKGCANKVPCFIGLTFRQEQMATAARAEHQAVAELLRSEIERMADDGALDRILLPWAYYQTEEIRAIFKVAQAEQRYRWAILTSLLLLLLAGAFFWQQKVLHESKLSATVSERENLAKTQVLRWVSHELRTPLNAVAAAANLLRQKIGSQDEDGIGLVTMIQSSSAVLTRLVGDLLDAAQFVGNQDGGARLESKATDLNRLMNETGMEFRLRARQQGLAFEMEKMEGLPIVELDEMRLRQVLSNLLSNALEHTRAGSIRVRVELPEKTTFRVEVWDSGTGIRNEDRERIFSGFERSLESREQRRGLGLGLALSKSIVEKMGGAMDFESQTGNGSMFWFEIPMKPAGKEAAEAREATALQDEEMKVLVVDDDRLNRVLLSRLVTSLGCKTECAENGEAALRKLEQERFDLVLMDCWMPVIDGYEATRAIRERFGKSIKVVGCTAHCLRSDIDLCFEVGMDDVIQKPVELDKLKATVNWVRGLEVGK